MHNGITLFQFLYDITLTVLLTYMVAVSFSLWTAQKKEIAFAVMGYFSFCLIDTIIIFMTEAIPEFAVWYEHGFIYSPSLKTLVFVGIGFFTMYSWNMLVRQKFSLRHYLILILLGISLLLIPLMPNTPLRAWLYFFTYQFFTFIICIYGMKRIQRNNMEHSLIPLRAIKQLIRITLLFSIIILIEDSIVIFFFDSYQLSNLSIYNRNISEDILRVYYISVFAKMFVAHFKTDQEAALEPDEQETLLQPEQPPAQEQSAPVDMTEYKQIKFGRHISLSEREMDVFLLLLEGCSNVQIGEKLCISKGTVKAHIHNIFQKADVSQRRELIMKFEEFDALS